MKDNNPVYTPEAMELEINESIRRVIEKKEFILGEEVGKFEGEVAGFLGVKHAIGLNSGTDAFRIALSVLGIQKGDEVIVPTFCFISDAAAVVLEGGTPVFVDIEPETCNIDVSRVEEKITDRTRAVIPAHMYGFPVDMDALLEVAGKHGVCVIEDACQAFGASIDGRKAGSLGDFAGFSFYPTKPIGCYGDAGLITTDDDAFAERIKMVRNHGSRKKYYHEFLGFSSRMDTIQAAILRVTLKYFDARLARLAELHTLYSEHLSGIGDLSLPVQKPNIRRGYSHYTIRTGKRDALLQFLKERGINAGVYYPLSIHLQEAFRYLGHTKGDFPRSELAQDQVLSLPLDMNVTPADVEKACGSVKDFF